ncbi:2-dehydro-3-deoxy-phosphogluconate aldolase [Microbacterium terricola]|uniref:2-dehydro-3-deoxy-phosphogluconate aldolase n=1 Tax=Microbacterium terricola TaxID=344163 RepID=A0ABM8DWB7_9MICO|nr:2-dehydro-3-deoxy-phosphogluconate aldolase [Microbacterium terricola]
MVRHSDDVIAERIARAAVDGGIGIIEITFTVPSAPQLIARLRQELPGIVIGAGTVLTAADVDAATAAGADFLVSPIADAEVMRAAAARSIRFIAGAATPTEVAAAWRGGAQAVKIFPAATLGPGFVSAVRDVLPGVPLIPTGGIRPADVGAWLSAGATAVGIAGSLTSAWQEGGADGVRAAAATAVTASAPIRSTR